MSQTVSPQDSIVVVLGPTGSGKSTFIECATRQNGQSVGHSLRSHTADIRAVRATHPNGGHPVVFVDTPGFDDTVKSDLEILSTIADWLAKIYKKKVNLAAIVYLHKISDNRMTGSLLRNLRTFLSMCGRNAMPNVVIATTMWGKVDAGEGAKREEELKRDFWKEIRTERFENTYESAWRIVGSMMQKNTGTTLLIQIEMVDARTSVRKTKAGSHANHEAPQVSKGLMNKLRSFFARSLGKP